MPKAAVFDIFRGTTHDGPGLRSTVFFQGCPLACGWCHNPEGIPTTNRVWWQKHSCIGCGLCVAACPQKAVTAEDDGIYVEEQLCRRCGDCVQACPSKALTFVAREWELAQLVKEVLRDRVYYARTGGGVTASGGECLLQWEFLAAFFSALQQQEVHTALDTSGFAPWSALEAVLPHTDCVLYDLKLWDEALHRQHTGQSNRQILDNATRIAAKLGESKRELWIRTPLIPGATATEDNIAGLAQFIRTQLNGAVTRWELCAFNNSCINKYQQLHQEWDWQESPPLRHTEVEALRKTALCCGLPQEQVVVTGILAGV